MAFCNDFVLKTSSLTPLTRYLIPGLSVILSGLAVVTVVKILLYFHLQDFAVYYRAVQDVLNGVNPYLVTQTPFIYPVSSLFIFLPFGILPFSVAERLWTLVSVLALTGAVFVLTKAVRKPLSWLEYCLMVGVAMLNFPVKFTLGMGQVNLILLFLLCISFLLYQEKRLVPAGVVLGVAAAVKVTPVVLLLFFIRKQAWPTVLAFFGSFGLISIIALLGFGIEVSKQYWLQVLPTLPTVGNLAYYNQALTGLLARGGVVDDVALVVNYVIAGGLLVLGLIGTKQQKQQPVHELIEYGFFVTVLLIGGGLAWQHHMALLTIPFFAIYYWLKDRSVLRCHLGAFFIAIVLISVNIKNPDHYVGISSLLLSHGLYGMAVLSFVLVSIMFCLTKGMTVLSSKEDSRSKHTVEHATSDQTYQGSY